MTIFNSLPKHRWLTLMSAKLCQYLVHSRVACDKGFFISLSIILEQIQLSASVLSLEIEYKQHLKNVRNPSLLQNSMKNWDFLFKKN